jgi:hypothetical protein
VGIEKNSRCASRFVGKHRTNTVKFQHGDPDGVLSTERLLLIRRLSIFTAIFAAALENAEHFHETTKLN